MKVYFPHINYTVHILRLRKVPKTLGSAQAYTAKGKDNKSCAIYVPKRVAPGIAAHEVVHALRYICEARHMDFMLEEEHMAYVAQHLVNQILGWEYEK